MTVSLRAGMVDVSELHFGVVVGIDHYPKIPDAEALSGAREDAAKFHTWLTSPNGGAVPEDNVEFLRGKRRGTYPTQTDVFDVLARWHTNAECEVARGDGNWEDTRLYLYAAGHGYAPDDGTAAVLMANASDHTLGYHIELQCYVEWLTEHAPFKEVLVFSDCCRQRLGKGAPSAQLPFSASPPSQSAEVFALSGYATRVGSVAYERRQAVAPDDERGAFTSAVLDGLGGAAADGGVVTSASLANYVRSAVEERTKTAPTRQKVEFRGDLGQRIVICRGSKPRRIVKVHFRTGAHGLVEILDGRLESVAHHRAEEGDWELDLEDGLYELRSGKGAGGVLTQTFRVIEEDVRVNA